MDTSALLVNLAVALIAATLGGIATVRLALSPIVGYIVAGIAIGPYTPGFVGDQDTVGEIAEIGVAFLLFAIGAQTSLASLRDVGRAATAGAIAQILAMIGVGYAVGLMLGLGPLEALFTGAIVSNSSSAVLGKVLGDRGEIESRHGQAALAWSSVQDLATIVLIVVLSALSTTDERAIPDLLTAIGTAAGFLVATLVVGGRVVPGILEFLASVKSREVFVLGVATLALGTASVASLFGISLALGAFLAGVVVGESDLSHEVVGEAVPFRDLFSGPFFVSIGMLIDPMVVASHLPAVTLLVLVIVVVKGGIVAIFARLLGMSSRTAVLVGATLGQCAEFSFLLATLGVSLGALDDTAFGLLLGAAAASVVLAPLTVESGHRIVTRLDRDATPEGPLPPVPDTERRRLAVVCGHGRVGRVVTAALERRGFAVVVVEIDRRVVDELRLRGIATIRGSAVNPLTLDRAGLSRAAVLVVTLADPLSVRLVVEVARRLNRRLPIIARTHHPREQQVLRRMGASEVVFGETELGLEMTRFALRKLGVSQLEAQAVIAGLRHRG